MNPSASSGSFKSITQWAQDHSWDYSCLEEGLGRIELEVDSRTVGIFIHDMGHQILFQSTLHHIFSFDDWSDFPPVLLYVALGRNHTSDLGFWSVCEYNGKHSFEMRFVIKPSVLNAESFGEIISNIAAEVGLFIEAILKTRKR